jgi:hypothetical protein
MPIFAMRVGRNLNSRLQRSNSGSLAIFAAIFPPRMWLGQHSDRQTSSRLVNFLSKGSSGYA